MDSALRVELRGRRLRRYLAEKQQRLRMPTYLPRVPPQYEELRQRYFDAHARSQFIFQECNCTECARPFFECPLLAKSPYLREALIQLPTRVEMIEEQSEGYENACLDALLQ